jgi:hypothetical protein
MKPKIPVCVRCGQPVKLAGRELLRHSTGHHDPILDAACGRWGFRYQPISPTKRTRR